MTDGLHSKLARSHYSVLLSMKRNFVTKMVIVRRWGSIESMSIFLCIISVAIWCRSVLQTSKMMQYKTEMLFGNSTHTSSMLLSVSKVPQTQLIFHMYLPKKLGSWNCDSKLLNTFWLSVEVTRTKKMWKP